MTEPFAPCPFCRAAGQSITIKIDLSTRIGEYDHVHMECKSCLARGPAYLIEATVHRSQDQLDAAVRHVTRLWNTRP